jgi:hypothetical protein
MTLSSVPRTAWSTLSAFSFVESGPRALAASAWVYAAAILLAFKFVDWNRRTWDLWVRRRSIMRFLMATALG